MFALFLLHCKATKGQPLEDNSGGVPPSSTLWDVLGSKSFGIMEANNEVSCGLAPRRGALGSWAGTCHWGDLRALNVHTNFIAGAVLSADHSAVNDSFT